MMNIQSRVFRKKAKKYHPLHRPATINPIPPENIIELWEKDYAKMREEMVYGENRPTFSEIIETLKRLKDKINNLNWEMI